MTALTGLEALIAFLATGFDAFTFEGAFVFDFALTFEVAIFFFGFTFTFLPIRGGIYRGRAAAWQIKISPQPFRANLFDAFYLLKRPLEALLFFSQIPPDRRLVILLPLLHFKPMIPSPPTPLALILAGGLGTRLRSVITTPKVLAPVLGRPFLTHLLDQLVAYRIPQVILATGHQADLVEAAIGTQYQSLRILYSRESEPRGTGGALRLALPQITEGPLMVFNGDSYSTADLIAARRFHDHHHAEATLVLQKVPDASRFGRVQTDPDGRILAFEEKQNRSEPAWVNAGIYFLSRRFLESIPENRSVSLEREVFPQWINRGLYAFHAPGLFHDIGTPESYPATESFLQSLQTN